MSIITILLFFVYTYGLGFTVTKFVKNSENFLERNLMRIGIGLGILPILGVLFNLLHIPLDWKIFLLVSFAFPVYCAFRKIKKKELRIPKFNFKLTKSNLCILIVLLLFFFTIFMYLNGAFKYPYLEDDDSWAHAASIGYISVEKTAFNYGAYSFNYMDPYPPGYDIVMSILHQTSSSLMWTLKFFNSLIISLGIIFFYFFVKEFTGNKNKALFSTFVLAAIPCFLTHFIWAHSLIIILFFVAFYSLEKISQDPRWKYVSAAIIASILVIQPSQAIKFGILFIIYFAVKSLLSKKFSKDIFLAGLFGFFASFLWWVPIFFRSKGLSNVLLKTGYSSEISSSFSTIFNPSGGSATRAYNIGDYLTVKIPNMINNPIGIGFFISVLAFIGLIFLLVKYKSLFSKENSWKLIIVMWFLFTFLGANSQTFHLPVGLVAFRFWMLMAIPLSILSAEGILFLSNVGKKIKISKSIILIIFIIGILITSAYPKYVINTSLWGPGGWIGGQINDYLWFKQLPPDTKVFGFNDMGIFVIGFDKSSCEWCKDVIEYRKGIINKSSSDIHIWLKSKEYEYAFIESRFAQENGLNETNSFIQELISSNLFQIVYQSQGMFVFKIV